MLMKDNSMTSSITPRRRTFIVSAALTLLVTGLAVSGCAESAPDASSQQAGDGLLADHDLEGLDAAAIIERLDTMPVAQRPTDLMASIRPDSLLLSDDEGREAELPMPRDVVYVSVAPYLNETHECYYHSLTTCTGELASADISVTLTDDSGDVLVDDVLTTYDNGFVGLWVPRDLEATLTASYAGRSATTSVSTRSDDDATCITTLHLI